LYPCRARFCFTWQCHYSPSGSRRRLRYIGRKAGISVHPHLFRHTLAQGVLDTTGNITSISCWCGVGTRSDSTSRPVIAASCM
jgi:integrase